MLLLLLGIQYRIAYIGRIYAIRKSTVPLGMEQTFKFLLGRAWTSLKVLPSIGSAETFIGLILHLILLKLQVLKSLEASFFIRKLKEFFKNFSPIYSSPRRN